MLSGIAPLFIFLHQPPKHQASARVSGLRLSATNDVTTPGFVLIVSLTISLWSYRSDRFDRSDRIAGRIVDRIALIFVLGSVLCFRYRSHYLLLKVRAVQDVIHLPNESRTCILQVVFKWACAQPFLLNWRRLNDT